jgi:hypothetical protein
MFVGNFTGLISGETSENWFIILFVTNISITRSQVVTGINCI